MMKSKEWVVVREFMDTVIWDFELSYISCQYYIHVPVSHSKCPIVPVTDGSIVYLNIGSMQNGYALTHSMNA